MSLGFIFRLFLGLIIATCSLSCGNKKKKDVPSSPLSQYKIGDQEYLPLTGNSNLSGDGSVIFIKPLGSIDSARNFELCFSIAEGGSLTLVAFANQQLREGMQIHLSRIGKELFLKTEGDKLSSAIKLYDFHNLCLDIDVHNNENPSHVMIWKTGEFSFGMEDLPPVTSTDPLLFDSMTQNFDHGKGKGQFWGLKFVKAEIWSAKHKAPRHTHDDHGHEHHEHGDHEHHDHGHKHKEEAQPVTPKAEEAKSAEPAPEAPKAKADPEAPKTEEAKSAEPAPEAPKAEEAQEPEPDANPSTKNHDHDHDHHDHDHDHHDHDHDHHDHDHDHHDDHHDHHHHHNPFKSGI